MRILNAVIVTGALLAFGGTASAQNHGLGSSRPGATEMKKKVERKTEKKVEKKEDKSADGSAKKEEKMEHTERSEGETQPSTGTEGAH